ncbi:hypothetical protein KSB_92180 [Ktedonobacter robiniae]|uniref:Uncharacterized protein n=1 Tax=Ktedonobacter robiniae TaxID=2778365 RepID=A0ABQ3V6R3_9CHLR|nr:hypothetical protein KSB_92180 [Ktedonobacter robiniae]
MRRGHCAFWQQNAVPKASVEWPVYCLGDHEANECSNYARTDLRASRMDKERLNWLNDHRILNNKHVLDFKTGKRKGKMRQESHLETKLG